MSTKKLLNRVAENLSVRRAFGTPYEREGLLVIPVAFVAGGGGVGEGPMVPGHVHGPSDGSPESDSDDSDDSDGTETGSPVGSGAGFGGLILPVGVYVVNGDDVQWKPAVNVTMIALASLSVLRLVIRMRTRVKLRHSANV